MSQKKPPSQRQLRVSEEIRHVLGTMLAQGDVFIDGLRSSYIMITEVQISPDLSNATVYVRAIDPVNTEEQVTLLSKHKGAFRYAVGKKMRLRIVPDLSFREDTRFEHSAHMADLLNSPRVRQDIDKHHNEDN